MWTRKFAPLLLAGAVIVGAAGPASAITPETKVLRQNESYVKAVRSSAPEAAFLRDSYIVGSGRYICQRKEFYRYGTQIGVTRTRLKEAIIAETNRERYNSGRLALVKVQWRYTSFSIPKMPWGFC